MENLDRVKRRLVSEAIADNVGLVRGLAPWNRRAKRARNELWFRRLAFAAAPLALIATTWIASTSSRSTDAKSTLPPLIRASSIPTMPDDAPHPPQSPDLTGSERFAAPKPFDTSALPLAVRHIVLDAGHGGNDPGTIALGGLTEKAVTLDIEMRLKPLLERQGFVVSTTRDSDHSLPLRDRAQRANASGADLFVSIHVNSLLIGKNRGVETYYLGPTDDPALNRLAAAENRLSGYSLADYRKLLDGIYADVRQGESRKLAEAVQREMFRQMRAVNPSLENWGVRRAPFVVLVATEMPAILAEVSCMSSDEEALRLGRPEYRQAIAEALNRGIRDYADSHNISKEKGT